MSSYSEDLYEFWKRLDHSGSVEEYDDVTLQWYDTYNPHVALQNRLYRVEWLLHDRYDLPLELIDEVWEQDVLSLRCFIEIADVVVVAGASTQ